MKGSARESISVARRVKEKEVERVLQMKVDLPGAESKEAQWPGTVRTRWGVSTRWMNPVSIGEYHGLRVGSALLSIVAGCIIIGVSRECDADAVGGIFLGAGGLGEYVENFVGTYWKFLFWSYFSPLRQNFCRISLQVYAKVKNLNDWISDLSVIILKHAYLILIAPSTVYVKQFCL